MFFCSVLNCGINAGDNCRFHSFPKGENVILQSWIEFTGRGAGWVPGKYNVICSKHFHPKDKIGRKLRKSSVPIFFPPENPGGGGGTYPVQHPLLEDQGGDYKLCCYVSVQCSSTIQCFFVMHRHILF